MMRQLLFHAFAFTKPPLGVCAGCLYFAGLGRNLVIQSLHCSQTTKGLCVMQARG